MAVTGYVEPYTTRSGQDMWRIRLSYGKDPLSGKRVRSREPETFSSEKLAKKRLQELLYEAARAPIVDPSRRSVGELLVEWLDKEAQHEVEPKTLRGYESCCRLHLMPAFGETHVRKLDSAMIERFRAAKLEAGTSVRMVELAVGHLRQAMSFAVRHGYASHNPATTLKRLRHEHNEMQVWTSDEAQRFLAITDDHIYSPLWHLALYTGMRKGELIGLQWHDVEFDHARLRVRRSLSESGPERKAGSTKTGHSRTIDLTPATVQLLHVHHARQAERHAKLGKTHDATGYVLTTTAGTPLNPFNIIREMQDLITRAGVPRIRFHDLRHTCASLLLGRGVAVHVVSRLLGHANAAITLRVYAHLMPGQGKEAAEVLRQALAGNS